MRKRIIAFYDILLYAIICGPMICISALIALSGVLNSFESVVKHWYFVLLFAITFMIPASSWLMLRYSIIENNNIYFRYLHFTISWEKAANNIDARWNQDVLISEIKDIEIVKLTEEEKQTKVYYKHKFNKYLKINLNYGNPKYVYVGNYSNSQIKRIIKLAMQNKL